MSIQVDKSQTQIPTEGVSSEPVTKLTFNNGDKKALDRIVNEWNFKDEEAALKFAMAVMLLSQNKELKIDNDEGVTESYKPTKKLLKAEKDD